MPAGPMESQLDERGGWVTAGGRPAAERSELSTADMAEAVLAKLIQLVDARTGSGSVALLANDAYTSVSVTCADAAFMTVMLPHAGSVVTYDVLVAQLYDALCTTRGRAWR